MCQVDLYLCTHHTCLNIHTVNLTWCPPVRSANPQLRGTSISYQANPRLVLDPRTGCLGFEIMTPHRDTHHGGICHLHSASAGGGGGGVESRQQRMVVSNGPFRRVVINFTPTAPGGSAVERQGSVPSAVTAAAGGMCTRTAASGRAGGSSRRPATAASERDPPPPYPGSHSYSPRGTTLVGPERSARRSGTRGPHSNR